MNKIIYDLEIESRIDSYLKDKLDISRTQVQKMIDSKLVFVNGKIVKANYKLKNNDSIEYDNLEIKSIDLSPQNLNLNIVYQDENVAVVYKPKGMVVHPANGNYDKTLVNGLLYELDNLSSINGVIRPGIVHRIDKDTTGLLLIAKNDLAHNSLSKQLKDKKVRRVYYALVEGIILENDGIINAPIGRDPKNRLMYTVIESGKESITTFHVIERFKDKTFVECVLKTGRTHQIRVHFKYIKHPVFGDPIYSKKTSKTINGQYLHAGIIGYNDPITNEYKEFSYPLPKYFSDELDELRGNKK
ncbi:RluA family pseudouridine synthase [bacterium]|nr:RluA family pseudouridine synthase [bacterium]